MNPGDKEAPGTGGTEGKALTSWKNSTPKARFDQVSVDDHADFIQAQSDRLECMRIIEQTAGTVLHFLNSRQPGFGDMTGTEILEQQPAELLRRLRQMEGH